jgi:hypothetical protein
MWNTYHVTSCPCIYRHMLSKTTIPNHLWFCFYCHLDYVPQQNRGRKKIEWGEVIHIVNLCIVSIRVKNREQEVVKKSNLNKKKIYYFFLFKFDFFSISCSLYTHTHPNFKIHKTFIS